MILAPGFGDLFFGDEAVDEPFVPSRQFLELEHSIHELNLIGAAAQEKRAEFEKAPLGERRRP